MKLVYIVPMTAELGIDGRLDAFLVFEKAYLSSAGVS